MKLAPRFALVLVAAAVVPLVLAGTGGLFLFRQLGQRTMEESRQMALESERVHLVLVAQEKARYLEQVLANYQGDVDQMRPWLESLLAGTPAGETPQSRLYSENVPAGWPGCGYVHPVHGAFANWDRRGYAGSVWLRRSVVEEALANPARSAEIGRLLRAVLPATPMLTAAYEKNPEGCDLVWIVLQAGIASTYPNDYGERLRINPAFNNLDESAEDYVRGFDASHRPDRSAGWMRPYLDPIKRVWLTSYVAPLYAGETFLGTVGVDVVVPSWTRQLTAAPVGRSGYTFLLAESGAVLGLPPAGIEHLIATPTAQAALRETLLPVAQQRWTTEMEEWAQRPLWQIASAEYAPALHRLVGRAQGADVVGPAGQPHLLAFSQVGQTGWTIGVMMPLAEALAVVQPMADRLAQTTRWASYAALAALAVAVAITILFGRWWARRYVAPINTMITAVDRVSQGGDWPELQAETNDELATLATSANRMVRHIVEAERLLDSIFNGVQEVIFLHAPDGRILRVNRRIRDLYGFTPEEATGFTIGQLSAGEPPYDQIHALGWVDRAAQGEIPVFEWRARHRDGHLFWVEIGLAAFESGGQIRIVATVRDIDAQKQEAARQQEQAEQLEQAQKLETMGTLAGGIAHDFNNILTGILGFTQMATLSLEKGHPAHQDLQEVYAGALRARDLVAQILTFSRRGEARRVPLDLARLADETVKLLRASAPATIEIERQLQSGMVLADPTQMHQVILNLATNALHAMRSGPGRLAIGVCQHLSAAPRPCRIGQLAAGSHIQLSVSDTGGGIDAAILSRIFDPFFTTKAQGEGTGLGLALVQGIVSAHGGAIDVTSAPGRGTRFDVFLPAWRGESVKALDETPPPRGNGEHVLLVDDERPILSFTSQGLRQLGYRTTELSDPREALQIVMGRPDEFSAIITDLTMPHLTGLNLLRQIRERGITAAMILTTGNPTVLSPEDLQGVPGVAVLAKPFARDDLARALHRELAATR